MDAIQVRVLLEEICDLVMTELPTIQSLRYEIELKSDNTPVTKADVYLEKAILNLLKSKIPTISMIGEETYQVDGFCQSEYVAVLDPIDGTENFCSGLKEWGVSFGIWRDNDFLGSFLLMPELNLRLLSGDEITPVASRIIGLSSAINQELLDCMVNFQQYRIMGCAVYNLYNVINGSYNKFINPVGAYIWDLLPGIMLALEQGCKVLINDKPYTGEFLSPTEKYRIVIER